MRGKLNAMSRLISSGYTVVDVTSDHTRIETVLRAPDGRESRLVFDREDAAALLYDDEGLLKRASRGDMPASRFLVRAPLR